MSVLLAVAHGSRDPASQDGVRALLRRAAAARPGLRAPDAYVDNAGPSARRALTALADDGVDDVVVLPLLLTPASHSKTDVAASVQEGRRAHPLVRLRYGRPLARTPRSSTSWTSGCSRRGRGRTTRSCSSPEGRSTPTPTRRWP